MWMSWMGCGPHLPIGEPWQSEAEAPVVVTRGSEVDGRVRFEVGVDAGSAFDPIGRDGTAFLVAHVLFDPLTGPDRTLSLETTVDTVSAVLECPAAAAVACSDALAEALVHFEPSTEALAVAREAALAATVDLDDRALAVAALQLTQFRSHPYGHLPSGRGSVVATLTPNELQRFHHLRYTRRLRLVASGLDDAGLEHLRASLASLPPPADLLRPMGGDAPLPNPMGGGLWVVSRPTGTDRATFELGWSGDFDADSLTEAMRSELVEGGLVDELTVGVVDGRVPVFHASAVGTTDRVGATLQALAALPGGVAAVVVVDEAAAAELAAAPPNPILLQAQSLFR